MSYPYLFTTPDFGLIAAEIDEERARQDAKFGPQNHPALDPRDIDIATRNEYALRANRWKQINAERAQPSSGRRCNQALDAHPHTAWDGILLEEVYEAMAEDDPAKLRAELVQVAAVACAWVQAIDRRALEERRADREARS